jgi:hypothetical protein
LIEKSGDAAADVGFVQTDLWDDDRSATVARNARGRDCSAEAANQCAAGVPVPRELADDWAGALSVIGKLLFKSYSNASFLRSVFSVP